MRYSTLTTALLAGFSMWGCEEVVDLDGGAPAQVVIDAQLRSGATPMIAVRLVDGFGHAAASSDLLATTGTIRASNGNVSDLIVGAGSDSVAYLSTESFAITPGLSYTLILKTPGFAQVKSLTSVPTPVGLRTGPWTSGALPSGDAKTVTLPFGIDAASSRTSYYHLLVWIDEAGVERPDTTAGAKPLPFRILNGERELYVASSNGYHFTDAMTSAFRQEGRIVVDTHTASGLRAPTVYVELRTVSESYYQHYRNLIEMGEGGSPGILLPPSPGTADNISGGRGLFAGYSTDIRAVALNP